MANVGKITTVEAIKGYKLNKKALGCKFFKDCFTCPARDCIKGKKYETPPASTGAFEQVFNASCDAIKKQEGTE